MCSKVRIIILKLQSLIIRYTKNKTFRLLILIKYKIHETSEYLLVPQADFK